MVTDRQVMQLFMNLEQGCTLRLAALRSGMDEKTAGKYRREWKLPSQLKQMREYRTRPDPFADVMDWLESKVWLGLDDKAGFGLQSQTLLRELIKQYPGRFGTQHLRTLQRRMKQLRATKGPGKEVYFPQVHRPGRLSQSDFTNMNKLGISIAGQPFEHLLFHFIFTYSNWEDVTICFSESFESLSYGLQNAWWQAGFVADQHQTDRMSAAVNKDVNPEKFTRAYQSLLNHYRVTPRTIGSGKANENGDVEKSHDLFKNEVRQELLLRGSKDFASRQEYDDFLKHILERRNSTRLAAYCEEKQALKPLPAKRLDDCKQFKVRVSRFSTIHIQHNTYSVHSRLIGEYVTVRVWADYLEIWYAQKKVAHLERLRGSKQQRVDYRHIIEWLVRKPGAFENYRYKSDLFPTSYFRMAFDRLSEQNPAKANKEYLALLLLSARESEDKVNEALRTLLKDNQEINSQQAQQLLAQNQPALTTNMAHVQPINLNDYDQLLEIKLSSNTLNTEVKDCRL